MMKQGKHPYISYVIPYVLGELSSAQREKFELHIQTGCHLCVMELAETEEALHGLPLALPRLEPPSRLKQEVRTTASAGTRIPRTMTSERSVSPSQHPWFGYASLGVIIAIVAGFWIFSENLITTIDSQAAEIVRLRVELKQSEEVQRILQAPRIEVIIMDGLAPSPGCHGKIIWDPAKRVAIFQVSHLPGIPEDMNYQLWIIKKRKPIPAGVFAVRNGEETENVFKIISLDVTNRNEIDAFAVTLEPKGGLPQPSGQMYLRGSARWESGARPPL